MVADALDHVLGPGLDVARGAAVEEDQKSVAAESAAKVIRGEMHAHELGELRHEVLAREHADGRLDLRETVGLDVGELAHAALHRVRAAFPDRGDQIPLLQEACGRIVLHRVRKLNFEITILAVVRGNADARGGLVLIIRPGERENQRQVGAVRQQRLNLEAVVRPLALQAGHERALQRGVRIGLEQIHERRAGERIVAGVTEELEPRPIGIDDDALLYVGDRVGRSLEEILQLFAILACG